MVVQSRFYVLNIFLALALSILNRAVVVGLCLWYCNDIVSFVSWWTACLSSSLDFWIPFNNSSQRQGQANLAVEFQAKAFMQLHPAMHLSIKDYTEARVAKAGLITLDAKLDLERPAQSLLQSFFFWIKCFLFCSVLTWQVGDKAVCGQWTLGIRAR